MNRIHLGVQHFFHSKLALSVSTLIVLNIIQFSYFSHQNNQLLHKLQGEELLQSQTRSDLADTRKGVTAMSQYFENKGNLTITALVDTVNQIQQDETSLQDTINTINGNVTIYNNETTHLQQELCSASGGGYCQ